MTVPYKTVRISLGGSPWQVTHDDFLIKVGSGEAVGLVGLGVLVEFSSSVE